MATAKNLEIRNSFDDYEQRVALKVFFAEGNSAAEAHRRLVGLVGKNALSSTSVKSWFQKFREENYDVKDHRGGDRKSGPEKDARIDLIKAAFGETRAWSMDSLSARVGFSRSAFLGRLVIQL